MKKLKLNLDNLNVDSFEPGARTSRSEGTVYGHYISDEFLCGSSGGGGTWLADSCGATCGGPCGPQTAAMHGCTMIE